MLAYYLSDLTTLLQNKEREGWEVGTINLIHADDEILCCDRRLRQRFIASCLSKKPFRLSLISTYLSFLVPTSSVGYRHPAVIACSVLCWGLSVYLIRRWHFQYYSIGKKGSFASWFTTLPAGSSESLLVVLGYVVPALSDASLCLPAANALRNLCDANRSALAPHITAFGELHAGLSRVQDTEKAKVLQSIASVIQALPPEEEIGPVEVCGSLRYIHLCYPR
jgi:hypothetical protein